MSTAPVVPLGQEAPASAPSELTGLGLSPEVQRVKAMTFDVFGTVVDFRSSVIAEGRRISARHGIDVDWASFTDQWRAEYRPHMDRVTDGGDWMNVDGIYRVALEMLVDKFGLHWLSAEELDDLHQVWHRLEPWGDSVQGLERLRRRYLLATLSNGNVRLLVDLARHGRLPWDAILSAELVRAYKPEPKMYRSAVEFLSLDPDEIMMVAAHQYDLRAAAAIGFRTALVMRPLEHGPDVRVDLDGTGFDLVANDMVDLARQLGL